MLFNENEIKNKIQHIKMTLSEFWHDLGHSEDKKQNERDLDKAVKDSFPASDPLGFQSKCNTDKAKH